MLGDSEHIQSEKSALVSGVVTEHKSLVDLAALDELCQTYKLTELALKVELVALFGYEIDVALAGIYQIKEFVYVYIAE